MHVGDPEDSLVDDMTTWLREPATTSMITVQPVVIVPRVPQNMEESKLAQLQRSKGNWKKLVNSRRNLVAEKLEPLFLSEHEKKR